jgi:hypothetical protein
VICHARPVLAVAGLLLAPAAHAHSPFPGLKGLYVGFIHPLTQPAQVMLIVALGIFIAARSGGLRGAAAGALVMAALVGLAVGTLFGAALDYGAALAMAVIAGAVGSLYPGRIHAWLVVAYALGGGLLLGLACVPDPGRWREVVITSLGSWLGIGYFSVLAIGGLVALLGRWPGTVTRVGVRVAAAWLVAMASMYAAFLWLAVPGA